MSDTCSAAGRVGQLSSRRTQHGQADYDGAVGRGADQVEGGGAGGGYGDKETGIPDQAVALGLVSDRLHGGLQFWCHRLLQLPVGQPSQW